MKAGGQRGMTGYGKMSHRRIKRMGKDRGGGIVGRQTQMERLG
jgi:hypothetical protein